MSVFKSGFEPKSVAKSRKRPAVALDLGGAVERQFTRVRSPNPKPQPATAEWETRSAELRKSWLRGEAPTIPFPRIPNCKGRDRLTQESYVTFDRGDITEFIDGQLNVTAPMAPIAQLPETIYSGWWEWPIDWTDGEVILRLEMTWILDAQETGIYEINELQKLTCAFGWNIESFGGRVSFDVHTVLHRFTEKTASTPTIVSMQQLCAESSAEQGPKLGSRAVCLDLGRQFSYVDNTQLDNQFMLRRTTEFRAFVSGEGRVNAKIWRYGITPAVLIPNPQNQAAGAALAAVNRLKHSEPDIVTEPCVCPEPDPFDPPVDLALGSWAALQSMTFQFTAVKGPSGGNVSYEVEAWCIQGNVSFNGGVNLRPTQVVAGASPGTTISCTFTSVFITGLSVYSFRVRAVSSGGPLGTVFSDWSGPQTKTL